MVLSPRALRLRLVWVLAIPFVWAARPTPRSLLLGALFALPGLVLRALASGHIDKDRTLAVTGPYAYLRHPLYLGSFVVGVGLVVAGGRWWVMLPYLLVFGYLYSRAVGVEERELNVRFGGAYRAYAARVPAFVPRRAGPAAWGFRLGLFLRNKEWEAGLGLLIGLGVLWLRMIGIP